MVLWFYIYISIYVFRYNLKIMKNYHIHLLVTQSLPSGFRAGVERIFVGDILYSYNGKNKIAVTEDGESLT